MSTYYMLNTPVLVSSFESHIDELVLLAFLSLMLVGILESSRPVSRKEKESTQVQMPKYPLAIAVGVAFAL